MSVPEKDILKHNYPDHPGKYRISWVEYGPYHTDAIERLTRYWYQQVLTEERESEENLMFISYENDTL